MLFRSVPALECPNWREMLMIGLPLAIIKEAAVCLRSWKRIGGNPAFSSILLKARNRLRGSQGVPIVDGKTRALAFWSCPSSLSSEFHCSIRICKDLRPKVMVRMPFFVLGSVNANPCFGSLCNCLRTCIVELAKSTSPHLRPSNSPWRMPVINANFNIA